MKNKLYIIFVSMLTFTFLSCNAEREDFQGEKYNSINAGDLKIYCDDSVFGLMDSTFSMYKNAYTKVNFSLENVNAREAMKLLLSGNAEAVVISRGFRKDEDSLMKQFGVIRPKMKIATDALVLFSKKDFPIDTLNDLQVKQIFKNELSFTQITTNLPEEPIIACNSTNSSEFSNIEQLILNGEQVSRILKTFSSPDSVINFVKNSKNALGVAYLSQIFGDKELKALEIGFTDASGYRVYPQEVHQGFILQGKYPYCNEISVYLREDRQNRAFWFASFISKEAVVMKYLKDMGIVPEYVKFKLKVEQN